MSNRGRQPANTQRRKILRETPLTGLVSEAVLQRVQDAAADTRGVSLSVRGLGGKPLTRASRPDPFCRLVLESKYGEEKVCEGYCAALKRAHAGAELFAFKSGTHLLHTAAPIVVDNERVACVVMSSPPKTPLSKRQLAQLARRTGVGADELSEALAESPAWAPEEAAPSQAFLRSVANTIGWLCVQGAILRGKLAELEALFEVTSLLAATLDLRKVLKLKRAAFSERDRAKKDAADAVTLEKLFLREGKEAERKAKIAARKVLEARRGRVSAENRLKKAEAKIKKAEKTLAQLIGRK